MRGAEAGRPRRRRHQPRRRAHSVEAHRVDVVVDPTGAGDCFCAHLRRRSPPPGFAFREALELANAAGALAVTQVGPMEGNSTLAEIERLLAARS